MLKRLHHWLGITVGVFLAVIALTGFLLLWVDEYVDWRYPALPEEPGLIQPDAAVVETILGSVDGAVTALGVPSATRPLYHAYLADGTELVFHPTTGELLGRWGWTESLPAFLFELHVDLLAGELGHNLVGVLGLLATVSFVTGWTLWMRKRRILRLRHVLPRRLDRAYGLRAHASQGALQSVLFVTLALTGVAMVFSGPVRAAIEAVLGADGPAAPTVLEVDTSTRSVDWSAGLKGAAAALPDATIRFLMPPSEVGRPLVVRVRNDGELHPNGRSYVVVHPSTGAVLETIDATTRGMGPAIVDSFYPIHAGKTGWPFYRLLLAVLGLSLCYIAVSGLTLFLTRPKRGVDPRTRAPALRRPRAPSFEERP